MSDESINDRAVEKHDARRDRSSDLRITTASGAVYDYRVDDEDDTWIRRVGPHSNGIDYVVVPDDAWHLVSDHTEFEVGQSIYFSLASGKWRITTPVVSIEENEG